MISYILFRLGLYKAGIKVAFLNHNLRQKSLLHCFNVSGAKTLIISGGKISSYPGRESIHHLEKITPL